MARYLSRPTASGWLPSIVPDDHDRFPEAFRPELMVDGPRGPTATGLLDAAGRELFRLPEPLGFHNPKD